MSTQTDKIREALELAANMTELNPVNFHSADVEDSIAEVISVSHCASEALDSLSELEAQSSEPRLTVDQVMEIILEEVNTSPRELFYLSIRARLTKAAQ